METLQKLFNIQQLDTQLLQVKRRYARVDRAIKDEVKLAELKKNLESCKTKELETKLNVARLKSERSQLQERHESLEKKLYGGQITNVREMKAVETEQLEAKRKVNRIDDNLGPLELGLEELSRESEQLEGQLADYAKEWEQEREELVKERSGYIVEYKKLDAERKRSQEGINAGHLKLYEELFRSKRGTAVVKVERGVCLGCNLSLPSASSSATGTAATLPRCPNCTRVVLRT